MGAAPIAPPKALEGTYWRASELAGKATLAQDPKREAHLTFAGAGRVSGSDGCNRFSGTYERKGDAVRFGRMLATQMACLDTAGIDRPFRDALKGATRMTISGDRMELFDASGKRLAMFTARVETSRATSPALAGTSWRLVRFQGGDGKTLTPDDRSKYTIDFAAAGRLSVRIDCNRGGGTWRSKGPNQVQFGPLALTRAKCPRGSLHDQIVKQWRYVRSYVVKDGHLFLALMADGGIYQFEPVGKTRTTPRPAPR